MDSLFQSTPNTHGTATETMPYIRRGIFDTHAHDDDEAFDEDMSFWQNYRHRGLSEW